jgi:hypothetical protein
VRAWRGPERCDKPRRSMRDIRRGRGRAFTAGAGLSCLLAACGSGTAAPAGKLSSSALQILMYGRPAPELRTKVDNAVSVLTTSCMRAKHLIYYPTLETLAQNSIPPTSEFPPYGSGSPQFGCPYKDFCAFSGTGFTGTKIEMYYCEYYGIPFGGTGSYVNNQTPGTEAAAYGASYNLLWRTGPAPWVSTGGVNWAPVYTVLPC